jgi:hypothetical protein
MRDRLKNIMPARWSSFCLRCAGLGSNLTGVNGSPGIETLAVGGCYTTMCYSGMIDDAVWQQDNFRWISG